MYRVPILVGANPRHAKQFSGVVNLGRGRWRIVVENLTNTRLVVHHDSPSTLAWRTNTSAEYGLAEIVLPGLCAVWVEFVARGNEDAINVFAAEAA